MKATVLYGFLFSLLIELSQILCLATTATTDVTDIIMNTLGTIIGYYIFFQAKDLSFMERMSLDYNDEQRKGLSKWEVYIYFLTAWLITFLLTPFISNEIWDMLWTSVIGIPM